MKFIKPCTVCKIDFNAELFYKSKRSNTGYNYRCKKCDNDARKKYRNNQPERYSLVKRKINLKCRYNLTIEQYLEILKKQNDCCAICLNPYPRSTGNYEVSFVVDHNHATGKIRGLLCSKCNRGIGFLGDNLQNFERAYQYIKKGE